MDQVRFIFWELLKILGVSFISLLAVKSAAGLKPAAGNVLVSKLARARLWLNALILALVVFGAWNLGYDIAAEVYYRVALSDAQNSRPIKSYLNALQAVVLRPGVLRYWQALESAKFTLGQWQSIVDDGAALKRVAGQDLEEVDAYRLAVSLFFLGRDDEALRLVDGLIGQNRFFLPPYILKGHLLTAQRNYGEAERAFQAALEVLPTDQGAVEGLAHAYFLEGNRQQALKVLADTSKFNFNREAQSRFEALEGMYAQ